MEKRKTLHNILSLALIIGVATELFLLLSPSESRNSLFLGHSITHLGMLTIVALVCLVTSWILWKSNHDDFWVQRASVSLQSNIRFIPAIFILGFGILISCNFFAIPAYKATEDLVRSYGFIYLRLLPLMVWGGVSSTLGLIALLILRHSSVESQIFSKRFLIRSIYLSAGTIFMLGYLTTIFWGWLGASN